MPEYNLFMHRCIVIDLPGAPPSPTPATGTTLGKASQDAASGDEGSFRSELNREMAANPPAATSHADAPSADADPGKAAARSQKNAAQPDTDAKDTAQAGKQKARDPAAPAAALALLQAADAAPGKSQSGSAKAAKPAAEAAKGASGEPPPPALPTLADAAPGKAQSGSATAAKPAAEAAKSASGEPPPPAPPAALPTLVGTAPAHAPAARGATSHGKHDGRDKHDPPPAGPTFALLHTPPAPTHSGSAQSTASTPAAAGTRAGVTPRALVPLAHQGSAKAAPQDSSAIAAAPTAVPGPDAGTAADKPHQLSRLIDALPAAHATAPTPPLHAPGTANVPSAQTSPSAASQPAAATLSATVGQPGWSDALGNSLVWMAGQHHQVAQLNLNPPDLGPLKITLTVHDNHASANFVSAHAAVRDAIQTAMPRLRDMLAHSGITLGQANVSAEAFQQQAQHQADPQPRAQPALAAGPDAVALGGTEARLRSSNGMVDIFA